MRAAFREALAKVIEGFETAADNAPDPTTQLNMRTQARDWRQYRDAVIGPECRACEFADEAAFAGACHDLDRPPHTKVVADA